MTWLLEPAHPVVAAWPGGGRFTIRFADLVIQFKTLQRFVIRPRQLRIAWPRSVVSAAWPSSWFTHARDRGIGSFSPKVNCIF